MVFCPECGTKNPENAQFCENCGAKLEQVNKIKPKTTQTNPTLKNIEEKWNKMNRNEKIITGAGACILGLLILGVIGAALPDDSNNLTDLQLYGIDNGDNDGEYQVQIDNNTTEYDIKGATEINATITMTAEAVNITNQPVKVNASNEFDYKIKIPKNVNEVTVKIYANKPGKDESYIELTIKRPTPTQPATQNTTTTPSTTTQSSDASSSNDFEIGYQTAGVWAQKAINAGWPEEYDPDLGGDLPPVVQEKSSEEQNGFKTGYEDYLKEYGYWP